MPLSAVLRAAGPTRLGRAGKARPAARRRCPAQESDVESDVDVITSGDLTDMSVEEGRGTEGGRAALTGTPPCDKLARVGSKH